MVDVFGGNALDRFITGKSPVGDAVIALALPGQAAGR